MNIIYAKFMLCSGFTSDTQDTTRSRRLLTV